MRFRMVGPKQYRSSVRGCRHRPIFLIEVRDAEVQEQIPLTKAQPCGCEIFASLVDWTPGHTVGKPQVIVCERIVVVREQNLTMQCYCGGIILVRKSKISLGIAELFSRPRSPTRSS